MSGRDSPSIRRFVRSAWILLGFQLVFAVAAGGVAIWAASAVRHLVVERDMLQLRVSQLEGQAAPAPAPAPTEAAPEPQPNLVEPEPQAPPPTTTTTPQAPPVRPRSNYVPPVRPPVVVTPPDVTYQPPYQPPVVYEPPPKPPQSNDPPRPPRRGPRIHIDVPSVVNGLFGRDRPSRTPNNPPTRVPGQNSNPTRPNTTYTPPAIRQQATPPRATTTVPTDPRLRRRVRTNDPQPPQIR